MIIERNNLMLAIIYSNENENYNTYIELLDIYYKLLEQENINDDYINMFITYDNLSDDAQQLLDTIEKGKIYC